MKVKICGLRHKRDIEAAVTAGADYIGLVFAESRRQVSVKEAQELAKCIPNNVKTVGVFVNPSLTEITEAVNAVPLDVVQLHGQESSALIANIDVPVLKALTLRTGEELSEMALYPEHVTFLLDAPGDAYEGGSGHVFDWQGINPESLPMERIFIAGGLNVENIREAIQYFKPYRVDVSSGVETDGQKDPSKIIEFIAKAKGE